jgi:DNA processing protein
MKLSPSARRAWLRLARTPTIGPVTHAALLRRFGDPETALDRLPTLTKGAVKPIDSAAIDLELEAIAALGGVLLTPADPDFPPGLAALSPPPPVVTVLGNPDLLHRPCVALVGSRDASAVGRRMARELAAGLGAAGWVVVSGLARGIDGEAHAASLSTGTVAVLAGGPDHIYPFEHTDLYAAIRGGGAIISESPPGFVAKAQDFPRRNRLITGLSAGVVVVEAAARSGSLISARTALEQGREVMAVPGSPLDPRARGTNGLIRQGATLVETAADVLACLSAPTLHLGQSELFQPPGPEWQDGSPPETQLARLREALSPTPVPVADLARATGLSEVTTSALLVELELSGQAQTFYGGLAALKV